jgi:hypothetical protein
MTLITDFDRKLQQLDRAITTVAEAMVIHNLPGLLVQIRRLEAERDRLLHEVDAIDYAKEIIRKAAGNGAGGKIG